MKYLIFAVFIFILATSAFAQTRPVTVDEYDLAFEHALVETNQQFPFIHTFTSERFENGSVIHKFVALAERQSTSVERQTFSTSENGKTSVDYQLRTASGDNVYCSSDGKTWSGPQRYECPRKITIYGSRTPTSIEYTVEEKTISGKQVKLYRKYETFEKDGQLTEFSEDIATIGPDGLFIETVQTMGTLQPRSVHTIMTNSWKLKAKFDQITIPENVNKPSKSTPQTIKIFNN